MKFMKCIFFMKFHEISRDKKVSPNEVKDLRHMFWVSSSKSTESFPPRDVKGFKGFLPQLDEFYFTTGKKNFFENADALFRIS
jgi:hypothetical protein